MHKSLVASLAQLIIGCWIRQSAFLLYRVGMASAISKQLKKKGDIDLSSRVFGKMTRTQPIDESLKLELAVDGYMWPRLSEYRARETWIGSNEDTRPKLPASCSRVFRGGSFLNARDDSKR
jgi:hypothetical protein